MRIGVLSLQGAFSLHEQHLLKAGAEYMEVCSKKDLLAADGLILPGGESGVMLKLINLLNLGDAIAEFCRFKPVWGICAGAILLAKRVQNPVQESFAALDIDMARNAYGRQRESSTEFVSNYPVSFIRAPRIIRSGGSVDILATRDGLPTWVEYKKIMVTCFHPETSLHFPSPWHERLIKACVLA